MKLEHAPNEKALHDHSNRSIAYLQSFTGNSHINRKCYISSTQVPLDSSTNEYSALDHRFAGPRVPMELLVFRGLSPSRYFVENLFETDILHLSLLNGTAATSV